MQCIGWGHSRCVWLHVSCLVPMSGCKFFCISRCKFQGVWLPGRVSESDSAHARFSLGPDSRKTLKSSFALQPSSTHEGVDAARGFRSHSSPFFS